MPKTFIEPAEPKIGLPLDATFRPAALWNRNFSEAVRSSKKGVPLMIGVERGNGTRSTFRTSIFPPGHLSAAVNLFYAERLVKMLLWTRGGYKVYIGGPKEIGEFICNTYSRKGRRAFDWDFMGGTVYERPFQVIIAESGKIPPSKEKTVALGRHLDGCRIGFDLGASDRKVSAVIDGEPVFSEEVPWEPGKQPDTRYHFHEVMSALHRAAARLPRLDAIGGSSAGVIINSRVMVASLFRSVPRRLFKKKVTSIFLKMKEAWGVPFEVVNDGEVTALAASMSLNINSVLGVALGSSQAGGYVTPNGNITNWLNELAFTPVDYSPVAPVDEWSGDSGCGVQYFSQVAVIRLAARAGIELNPSLTPAEKLKSVQELLVKGDERARKIFETVGGYLGYGIAHYADFYDLKHVLVLGRVTSGEGGPIILEKAKRALLADFPELASKITLHLPDERSRCVGQSIAAASLAQIRIRKGK
jgi:predicted NBD/HSP70 family sugar kinase